jgi:hypothetical protein
MDAGSLGRSHVLGPPVIREAVFGPHGRQPSLQRVSETAKRKSLLSSTDQMISALIKENRDLHRQIDKLSKLAVGAGSGIAERALRSLQRRISGTVDGGRKSSGRRSAPTAPASRRRGKITDPELLERRRGAGQGEGSAGSQAGWCLTLRKRRQNQDEGAGVHWRHPASPSASTSTYWLRPML